MVGSMWNLRSKRKEVDLQQKLDDQLTQNSYEDCNKRCKSMIPNGQLWKICKLGCNAAHQSHPQPIQDMQDTLKSIGKGFFSLSQNKNVQDTYESIGRSFFHLSDIISMADSLELMGI